MKKILQFQPELVILAFPEDDLRANPKQINKGLCMRWAYIAYQMFEGVELWDIGSHAFVRVGDKFYDSERLQGEEDWRDLPACNFGVGCGPGCKRCQQGAARRTLEDFQSYWNGNPIKPNWEWYNQLAEQALAEWRKRD